MASFRSPPPRLRLAAPSSGTPAARVYSSPSIAAVASPIMEGEALVPSPGRTKEERRGLLAQLKILLKRRNESPPTKEEEKFFLSGWTKRYFSVVLEAGAASGPPPVQGHGADASAVALRNRARVAHTPGDVFSPLPRSGTPGDPDLASAMGRRLGFGDSAGPGSPAPGAGAGAGAGAPPPPSTPPAAPPRDAPPRAEEMLDTNADYGDVTVNPFMRYAERNGAIQAAAAAARAAAAAPSATRTAPSKFSQAYSTRYGKRGGTRRRHRHRKNKKHAATHKHKSTNKPKSTSHRRRSHTRVSRRRARGAK